jgi:hypothetical protein
MGRIEDAIGGGRITPAQITDLFLMKRRNMNKGEGLVHLNYSLNRKSIKSIKEKKRKWLIIKTEKFTVLEVEVTQS